MKLICADPSRWAVEPNHRLCCTGSPDVFGPDGLAEIVRELHGQTIGRAQQGLPLLQDGSHDRVRQGAQRKTGDNGAYPGIGWQQAGQVGSAALNDGEARKALSQPCCERFRQLDNNKAFRGNALVEKRLSNITGACAQLDDVVVWPVQGQVRQRPRHGSGQET